MDDRRLRTTVLLDRWHERGDRSTLNAVIERYLPWIQKQAERRLGPQLHRKVDTGDIVAETLLELLRYLPRIKITSDGDFRRLLATMVENALRGRHEWYSAQRRAMAKE